MVAEVSGAWGMKGELSLASPTPVKGVGLARDSFWRIFRANSRESWVRDQGRRAGVRMVRTGTGWTAGGRQRDRADG